MSIFVVGATSQIGYFLLARLRQRQQWVVALSRAPIAQSDALVRWQQGHIADAPVMKGLASAVSFGPLGGLAQWLAKHDVAPAPRLLATSSMSVLSKANSSVASECELVEQLVEGEEALKAQCQRLGMGCTLLRPTLIYGAGRDKSLTPIAQRAARWRVFPFPAGNGLRQPVHADDLAQIILLLMDRGLGQGMTLQVGGGERLGAGEMFRRVHQALPVASLSLPLPAAALALLAKLSPRLHGPISRLGTDLVADNAALTELSGFSPRPFVLAPWMLGLGEDWSSRLQASLEQAW